MVNTVNVVVKTKGFGIQIFDKLHAYRQSLDTKTYTSNLNIEFNDKIKPGCCNILYCYMPDKEYNLDDYDIVLFDIRDEPLGMVCTQTIIDNLHKDNVYVQANSVFGDDHSLLRKKTITLFGDVENYFRWNTNFFYPQFYQTVDVQRDKNVIYINGSNRAHRNYFLQLCNNLPVLNSISKRGVVKTLDSFIEDEHDRHFRDTVNDMYEKQTEDLENYYPGVQCGLNGKLENIPLGYFTMEEYWKYKIVAFPETTWLNNEISITEKSLKCFYAGCLPFVVGGRHSNKLYNELGFYTAWNLLPDDLKQFDNEPDHLLRYKQMADALKWLESNIDNLTCVNQYKNLVDSNTEFFYKNRLETLGVLKLDKLIEQSYNKLKHPVT